MAHIILFLALSIWPWGHGDLDGRLASYDGKWYLPVADSLLGSDEADHTYRGSINSWDLTVPEGSPIYAMGEGRVSYAGCNNQGGYGCWVMIDHPNGWQSKYAHMIKGTVAVSSGDKVDETTHIGNVGWTGLTSFGPHVHFVVMVDGTHGMLDEIWPKDRLTYCKFCAATAGQVPETSSESRTFTVQRQRSWQVLAGVGVLLFVMAGFFWNSRCVADGALEDRRRRRRRLVLTAQSGLLGVSLAALSLLGARGIAQAEGAPALNVARSFGFIENGYFQRDLEIVLAFEGCTLVDHEDDPGGLTKCGVTQGAYDTWRRQKGYETQSVSLITAQEVESVYYDNYWLKSGADDMPRQLGLAVFDWAVNAGPGRAMMDLSSCVGIPQEKRYSPSVKAALAVALTFGRDSEVVRCVNDKREDLYRNSENWEVFGRGWMNRLNKIREMTEE